MRETVILKKLNNISSNEDGTLRWLVNENAVNGGGTVEEKLLLYK